MIRMPGWLSCGGSSLLGLQMAAFLLFPHMTEGKGEEREEEGEGRERERGRIFAKIIYFKKIKKIFYGLTCGIWQFPGQGARC